MARPCNPSLRAKIVEKAEHLMHLRGFHRTSLDEIASACGMTKANLLHHFRSKEALGLAVLDYKIEAYRCGCARPLSECADPVAGVRKMFADAACFFRSNGCRAGCFVANIALETADLNERFRERVRAYFEEWTGGLEAALRRGRAAGRFVPAMRPRHAAEAVIALYEGAILLARTSRDPGFLERAGKEAARLLDSYAASAPEGGRNGSARNGRSSNKMKKEVHHGP